MLFVNHFYKRFLIRYYYFKYSKKILFLNKFWYIKYLDFKNIIYKIFIVKKTTLVINKIKNE